MPGLFSCDQRGGEFAEVIALIFETAKRMSWKAEENDHGNCGRPVLSFLWLTILIILLLMFCSCSRQEQPVQDHSLEKEAKLSFRDQDHTNVPRTPHPAAGDFFEIEGPILDEDASQRLAKSAEDFLTAQIPDFAIKDDDRPWLDRQYVPVKWTVVETPSGIRGNLQLEVLSWDEGRPKPSESIFLELGWKGGEWVVERAPEQFARDIDDAGLTLRQDWRPGERSLP